MRTPQTISLVVGAVASASAAHAGDPAAADVLFREGRAAVKRGDFAAACPKFAESQRLDPAAGTLLNLAECEEQIGQLARAWEHYRTAMDQFRPGDDRLPIARKEWEAVDKRVPRLTIKLAPGAPDGAKVTRDGLELEGASLGVALPVDPGEHEIVVSAPRHKERRFAVTLRERQAKRIDVDVGDAAPASGEDDHVGATTDTGARDAGGSNADGPQGSRTRTIGFVVGGIGLAGVVLGGAALYAAHDAKSSSDQQYDAGNADQGAANYRRAQHWQTVSIASLALGGAGLATGAVLVLTAPKEPTVGVGVAPMFAVRAAGLSVAGMW